MMQIASTAFHHLLNQAIVLSAARINDAVNNQAKLKAALDALDGSVDLYRIQADLSHEIEQEKKKQTKTESYYGVYQHLATQFRGDNDVMDALDRLNSSIEWIESGSYGSGEDIPF